MSPTLQLPEVFTEAARVGANLLASYTDHRLSDGNEPWFTGAEFETFQAPTDPHLITAADVLSVSMLAVDFPAHATLRLLGDLAPSLSAHLRKIPVDLDLGDATDVHIGRNSDAWKLWDLIDGLHGVGPTLTSKLLARKRPRLVPVQDRHIEAATGLGHDGDLWAGLRELLNRDDKKLVAKLQEIRTLAGVGDRYTDLRVFDIVVWMSLATSNVK